MRLVFAGTPEPAVAALDALLASRHQVIAAVTQPDRRAGRGRRLTASPVARRAEDAGIEVLRPERVGDESFTERLVALRPDCVPVAAYGALVPERLLALPPQGWVNLHFSLLPAWRGAAPVQHAIRAGDDITGVTAFRVVRELDAGPVYGTATEPIEPTDTAGSLLARLASRGAELLVRVLDSIEAGTARPVPQQPDGVSYAPKVRTADAAVDWTAPANVIDRRIRSVTPVPGAWTAFRGQRLKLGPVTALAARSAPGLVTVAPNGVTVGTGAGSVRLATVQPAGRAPMSAADWWHGVPDLDGSVLGGCDAR